MITIFVLFNIKMIVHYYDRNIHNILIHMIKFENLFISYHGTKLIKR